MDITCIISALLFFLGNLLKLLTFGSEKSRDYSWKSYTRLEISTLESGWFYLIDNKVHLVATGVISSLAWFVFCFPMLQLVYVLHHSQTGSVSKSLWLHSGIIILVLGSSFMEWIANFLYIGATLNCEYMFRHFNIQTWTDMENDKIGLRSLEVAYFAIRGMIYWVDAFEWIALSVIMIFIFVSISRHQKIDRESPFHRIWNSLGLFIGLLCLLDFVTEILRTVSFKVFSEIAFWYGTLNRLILLPAWLIVLGWRLPYALMRLEGNNNNNNNNNNKQHYRRHQQEEDQRNALELEEETTGPV